ncbi:MAG: nucleoside-diphosphate kinase [Treponema sp.]|jgi:nucleoside-diphosphate kinase|nr:nucleoside-diphosphate kinase [Treponema sp.]
MEKTFVMLKPGVLHRRIVGEILTRFERKGLKIVALKLIQLDEARARSHYAEHADKAFFYDLATYIVSGPVIACVLEGTDAVAMVRRLIGPTKVQESLPGTIRGDYAYATQLNIVHASDSKASAQRELAIFFNKDEIYEWEDGNAEWF